MISIRHIGIYVNNIEKLTAFYQNVFDMVAICENQKDSNELLDELFDFQNSKIMITKLITEQGKKNGTGDMIELVKVLNGPKIKNAHCEIFHYGNSHIAMGVDDLNSIEKKIILNGGLMQTKIIKHYCGNRFAFAEDPEGNWIELIEKST